MASTEVGLNEGDVLAGKYRVERRLGKGGMGVVVAVRHLHLDQKFAIKLMLPEMLADEEARGRFLREARAAAKIRSEHAVRVFDVDSLENGAPYIVMDLLDGQDLAETLVQKGSLPAEQAVDYVLQACEVVAEAHALGIIHRDLKPGNLFCARATDGHESIKVLDFGISKIIQSGEVSAMDMTRTATSMGSPFYMSPEQMQSARDVDGRTDIWAIGVILHKLISGTVPFDGHTPLEVGLKIAGSAPPALRTLRPEIPAGLEAIVLRCLEKEPAARFANVAALADALAEFAPARSRGSLERIARRKAGAGDKGSVPGQESAERSADAPIVRTMTAQALNVAAPANAPLPGPVSTSATPPPAASSLDREARTHLLAASSGPAWGKTMPPRRTPSTGVVVAIAVSAAGAAAAFFFMRPDQPAAPPEAITAAAPPAATLDSPHAAAVSDPAASAPPVASSPLIAPSPPLDPPASPPTASPAKAGVRMGDAAKRSKPSDKVAPSAPSTIPPPPPSTSPPPKPAVWESRK